MSFASKLRQVPDNQEVYIDKDGFTSIIFEICERVGPSGATAEIDGKALSTHLEELVGDDADSVRVWNTTDTQFSELPYVLCKRLSDNTHLNYLGIVTYHFWQREYSSILSNCDTDASARPQGRS